MLVIYPYIHYTLYMYSLSMTLKWVFLWLNPLRNISKFACITILFYKYFYCYCSYFVQKGLICFQEVILCRIVLFRWCSSTWWYCSGFVVLPKNPGSWGDPLPDDIVQVLLFSLRILAANRILYLVILFRFCCSP